MNGPATIARDILNGNRSDAATAIATTPNPANMAMHVMRYLIGDHGYDAATAIETMTSLTDRTEFWTQEDT
jgi:hypothetical protein